jgi:hypothetical protein
MVGRPRYETQSDIANSLAILERVCQHLKCEAVHMPHAARVNYLLHKNGIAGAALEIKVRKNKHAAYPTLMFSKDKYDQLCKWSEFGLAPILTVQWADALGWVKLPVEHKASVGGRYDRGDRKDIEDMVLIGIDKFILFDNA